MVHNCVSFVMLCFIIESIQSNAYVDPVISSFTESFGPVYSVVNIGVALPVL